MPNIFLFVLIAVVGAIAGLPYLFLRKRKYGKIFLVPPLLTTVIIAYLSYSGIFPNEDFYRAEFHDITGIRLPENAIFLKKDASLPIDPHGDYCSAALIMIDESVYDDLMSRVKADVRFDANEKIGSAELYYVVGGVEKYRSLKFVYQASRNPDIGEHLFVGFLDDGKTIIAHKCNS